MSFKGKRANSQTMKTNNCQEPFSFLCIIRCAFGGKTKQEEGAGVAPARVRSMKKYDLYNLTVLIVDKQSLMRRLMRDVLSQLGIPTRNIEETSDINAAYDLYVASDPDIILTDWAPLLDGIEFIRKIRNSEDSPNPFVPIIVVTAFSELKHVVTARDSGMTEYLTKPISAKTLYLRLCSVIERERLFIRSRDFFGPDRRRRRLEYQGGDRRTYSNINGSERRAGQMPFNGPEKRQGYTGYKAPEPREAHR